MQIIGLTGGIASGKSTVARLLRAAGVDVVDADELAREAVAPGTPGLAAIVERFGAAVLAADGTLDRPRLGAVVFADEEARRDLNEIIHPRVAELAATRAATLAEEGRPRMVYEVPLLFESGLHHAMDVTVLVAVPENVQLERLMRRDGLDESAARARIRAQMPLGEKRALATWVIDNSGSFDDTTHQVAAVWKQLTGEPLALASG